jgi:CubicO group peptidase (beta-lactamase class C family)
MPSEESLAGVAAIFKTFVAEHGAPGVVYAVVEDGAIVATGARGVARLDADAPPGTETMFRIASMTKSFTAATVLMLRDEGRLRPDDEVAASPATA